MNQPESTSTIDTIPAPGLMRRLGRKLLWPALIGLLLVGAGCQRTGTAPALTAPNPELNFRVLHTEPCTGCREYREARSGRVFYGLPRRVIRAQDIVGLRRYEERGVQGIELRFALAADAKILAFSKEHVGQMMAVMIGEEPVQVSTVQGAFSGAMVMTGYSLPEREALFHRMTAASTAATAQDSKNAASR